MTREWLPPTSGPESVDPSVCEIIDFNENPEQNPKNWAGTLAVGDLVYVGDEENESFIMLTTDGKGGRSLPKEFPEVPFCCVAWTAARTPRTEEEDLLRWVEPRYLRIPLADGTQVGVSYGDTSHNLAELKQLLIARKDTGEADKK